MLRRLGRSSSSYSASKDDHLASRQVNIGPIGGPIGGGPVGGAREGGAGPVGRRLRVENEDPVRRQTVHLRGDMVEGEKEGE
mgnify:CR=1 FL=1